MPRKILRLHDFGRSVSNGPWGKNNVARILNRLYYVNSGTCIVNYAKKDYVLTAGNVYILPQCKDFHRVDAKEFDHLFFDYYSSLPLRYNSFTEIPGEQFNLKHFFDFIRISDLDRRSEKDRAVALDMLTAILSYIDLHFNLPYVSDKNIVKALKLFETQPNISTREIANQLNLNESYFIRMFSKTMGVSPMKFSRLCKLSLGLTMIQNGHSISQAAEACGYTSVSAFGKAFRKNYGCSPLNSKDSF